MSTETRLYTTMVITALRGEDLCLVIDPVSEVRYGFQVERIVDYRGETARKLGLKPGKAVLIQAEGDTVVSVKLTPY